MTTLADVFARQAYQRLKELPAEREAEERAAADRTENLKKLEWYIDYKIMSLLEMLDEVENILNANRAFQETFYFDFGIPANGREFYISLTYSKKTNADQTEPNIERYMHAEVKTPRLNIVFRLGSQNFDVYRGDVCEFRGKDAFYEYKHRQVSADNLSVVVHEFAQWCGNMMPDRIDELTPVFRKYDDLYKPEETKPLETAPPKRKRVLGIF